MFIVCAVLLIQYFWNDAQADTEYNNIKSLYTEAQPQQPEDQPQIEMPEGYREQFRALYGINPDIKGWITIPNTTVDYPVAVSYTHLDVYKRQLPILLVGTTAGTGSEVTATSVLTIDMTGTKKSVNHPSLYAKTAFADPKYTYTLPYDVTVSTALDAFSHAVEGYFSPHANDCLLYTSAKIEFTPTHFVVKVCLDSIRLTRSASKV